MLLILACFCIFILVLTYYLYKRRRDTPAPAEQPAVIDDPVTGVVYIPPSYDPSPIGDDEISIPPVDIPADVSIVTPVTTPVTTPVIIDDTPVTTPVIIDNTPVTTPINTPVTTPVIIDNTPVTTPVVAPVTTPITTPIDIPTADTPPVGDDEIATPPPIIDTPVLTIRPAILPLPTQLPSEESPLAVFTPPSDIINLGPKAGKVRNIGCFGDSSTRAMTGRLKDSSPTNCIIEARKLGSKYVGLQWPDGPGEGLIQCFYSNEKTYDRYGTASNCKTGDKLSLGGGWSNSVYELV